MKKIKGFTLIELLAVIVILGLLMAIAIPSVTKYITESRKKTLTTTIENYANALVAEVNDMEYIFTEANTIYAVPIECIALERGGTNPFGEWMQASNSYWAYVLVQYDDSTSSYTYGFTFKDSAGYGLYPTTLEKLNENGKQIQTNLSLVRPTSGLASFFVNAEIWKKSGFYYTEETRMRIVVSKLEGQPGDGISTCTLSQKGNNYEEVAEERNKPGTLINNGNRDGGIVFGKELNRSLIEEIHTYNYIDIPNDVIDSWDASSQQNGSIMAWITDHNKNGMYELYLAQEGGVGLPSNSNYLFYSYNNTKTMDLSNLRTNNVIFMGNMFNGCNSLVSLNLKGFDTSKVTTMENMFLSCNKLTSLDLGSFNTSNVTSMSAMFEGCTKLTNLNISSFDTSNVTNFNYLFYGCNEIMNIDLSKFNTSKAKSMSYMFASCNKLVSLDLRSFDTRNVTSMGRMFLNTSSLTNLNVSSFNTSNVTDMWQMFYGSSIRNLNIKNFDTSKVTNMNGMFEGCSNIVSLDLTNFNTSKVTNMGGMFRDMSSLENINVSSFDTSNVTNMDLMFGGCKKITTLNLYNFNTKNVTSMWRMFINMSGVTNINLSSFDTSKVESVDTMFHGCTKLQYLDIRNFVLSDTVNSYSMIGYVPTSVKIIVKDSNTRTWFTSNFGSQYNNIVTVSEL